MTRRSLALLLVLLAGCGLRDVPTHPGSGYTLLGTVQTVGIGQDIIVRDGLAYVAEGEVGFTVYDVSDPASPSMAGTIKLPNGYSRGIDLTDSIAVLASGEYAGLMLISVSSAESPQFVGAVGSDFVQSPVDVVCRDGLAFAADKWGGVAVYEVTNPAAPHFMSRVETLGYALAIQLVDSLAYVAGGQGGLELVVVSNPHKLELLSANDSPGYGYDVAVGDGVAYLADGRQGVMVVDVSDPSNPATVGTYDTEGQALRLFLDWPLLYVADDWGGLTVLDVSNPAAPALHSGYEVDGATAVWVDDDGLVYVLAEYDGLLILERD
jgi:hypothetical protein